MVRLGIPMATVTPGTRVLPSCVRGNSWRVAYTVDPPGLVLGKKDGGVILAHDAGISQVLERAFQDAGLGAAEKAACEIGRHFLFQRAVCMVKKWV